EVAACAAFAPNANVPASNAAIRVRLIEWSLTFVSFGSGAASSPPPRGGPRPGSRVRSAVRTLPRNYARIVPPLHSGAHRADPQRVAAVVTKMWRWRGLCDRTE